MWHVNVSKQRMVQLQGGWCWLRASPMLTGISVGQSAVKGTCQWSVLWLRWYTQQSAPEYFTWLLWLFVNFFYYSYSSRNKHFSPCTAYCIRRAFQSYWNKMNNNRQGKRSPFKRGCTQKGWGDGWDQSHGKVCGLPGQQHDSTAAGGNVWGTAAENEWWSTYLEAISMLIW